MAFLKTKQGNKTKDEKSAKIGLPSNTMDKGVNENGQPTEGGNNSVENNKLVLAPKKPGGNFVGG